MVQKWSFWMLRRQEKKEKRCYDYTAGFMGYSWWWIIFTLIERENQSLTRQDKGNESAWPSTTTTTKPRDDAREVVVADERRRTLSRLGFLHDHVRFWSDNQLLGLLLLSSCRWVVSNCFISRWTGRLLLLLLIRWCWWIQALGLFRRWTVCRRKISHDDKIEWCRFHRYNTDYIKSMKVK